VDAFVDVGKGAGERGEVELFGLVLGEFEQHGLQISDLTTDLRGVQLVAVGEELCGLCGREDLGRQEPVQRGLGSVVDPGTTAVAV
jgi:hypothetical protein